MRKFLASVGNAKLLGKVNGEFTSIADVRTLTESTLSFSTTMEEVRAGEGAQLYGRFAHDSSMTVTLTDAMFDMEYIALQVGSAIRDNGGLTGYGYYSDRGATYADGVLTVTRKPQRIGNACNLDKIVVWVRPQGCGAGTEWQAFEVAETDIGGTGPYTINVPASVELEFPDATNPQVCVEYFVDDPSVRTVQVKSNFFPAELALLLTTKLFAGDDKHPETGKPVGSITVKIPRFQLDGQFDLSMAMSSAATISLNGTALAVDDGTCDGSGIYAEIVQVIEGESLMSILQDVVIDPEGAAAGEKPSVWVKTTNGISVLSADNYEVWYTNTAPTTLSGEYQTGDNYIVVYDKVAGAPAPASIDLSKAGEQVKYTSNGNSYYYYFESITIAEGD